MRSRLLLLASLCAFLATTQNRAPDSIAVSSLKYDAFDGKPSSTSATYLLWSLGKAVLGRTGGSLAVLRGESREYLGWIDENGEIQAALDSGDLGRDMAGKRLMLEYQPFTGASLYLRRNDVLERVPEAIEKVETKVVEDGKEYPASYRIYTGRPPGPHAVSLLATFGLAIKGQQNRIHLTLVADGKPYDRTAILSESGKLEKIVSSSWGLEILPTANAR